MTDVDVQAYLESKGVLIKHVGGTQLNVPCFFHGEDDSKPGRLYFSLDEETAPYWCHSCQAKGNIHTLRKHFGDPPLNAGSAAVDDTSRLAILEASCAFFEDEMTPEVLRYLKKERCLDIDTIKRARLGWAPGGMLLFSHLRRQGWEEEQILATGMCGKGGPDVRDLYQRRITLPVIVNGAVVSFRGRAWDKGVQAKYLTPTGHPPRLYGIDDIRRAETVLCVEGEFDQLVLSSLGFKAVGMPGAGAWQEPWSAYLEDAKRVWVLTDPDSAGQQGRDKVLAALGAKARAVELPVPDGVDPGEVDPTWLVREQGWDVTHFGSLLVEASRTSTILRTVDDAYDEWHHLQTVGGLKFGCDFLDTIIRPGLRPGQLVVPLGKTNLGKSGILFNWLERMLMAQPDLLVLLASLELTMSEWLERQVRLSGFYHPEVPPADLMAFVRERWGSRLAIIPLNRLRYDQLNIATDDFVAWYGRPPDLTVVDYLGYYARGCVGSSLYERVTNGVMELKEYSKSWELVTLSPHQLSRGAEFGVEPNLDDARDAGAVEETADLAITMWSPDQRTGVNPGERTGELLTRLAKTRSGGRGTLIRYQFAPLSMAYVPHEDPMFVAAKAELAYEMEGISWQEAQQRHHALGRSATTSQRMVAAPATMRAPLSVPHNKLDQWAPPAT